MHVVRVPIDGCIDNFRDVHACIHFKWYMFHDLCILKPRPLKKHYSDNLKPILYISMILKSLPFDYINIHTDSIILPGIGHSHFRSMIYILGLLPGAMGIPFPNPS